MSAHALVPAMLFTPGDDAPKLEKLWSLDVPAFVLDLEDAVAESHKQLARDLVIAQLDRVVATGSDKQLYVRVNGATTPHVLDDLLAIVRPGLAGLLIPKVGSADDLRTIDWVVARLEAQRGVPAGDVGYVALLESAAGILNAAEIARSSPRLRSLCFGAGDLSADLGVVVRDAAAGSERAAFIASLKAQVVLASSAAGLDPPHEGVHTDFRDLDGLRATSEAAREIGFFGRHAIHPAQIPVIEEVFAPRAEDVRWAERIVREFRASEARGSASLLIGGEFVDYAIVLRAERMLALAGHDVADLEPAR